MDDADNRVTGQLVTAARMNSDIVENAKYLEEAYCSNATSDVAVTATTAATATTLVSGSAITYEAVPHLVEFYCAAANAGAGGIAHVSLYDGSTEVAQIGDMVATTRAPTKCEHTFTPSAVSHTYSIRAWNAAAGTATFRAGTGTGGALAPMFFRITRIP